MFICPSCDLKLKKVASAVGRFWSCPVCHGRALTLPVLRKVVPEQTVSQVWNTARTKGIAGDKTCPSCGQLMKVLPLDSMAPDPLTLDVCLSCHFVWFDNRELESVPQANDSILIEEEQGEASAAALAKAEMMLIQEERRSELFRMSSPDNWWEVIPAVFGLPVEYDYKGIVDKPILTWSLSGLMILIFVVAANVNPDAVIKEWGLLPVDLYRHYGLTFLTSFLLHGGLFHLISNLYFFIVFGDNVEDELGRAKYLMLIGAAALLGDAFHVLADQRAAMPLVGASGAISGIMIFYALQFPKTRVGIFVLLRWYRIPVGLMIFFWLLSQALGIIKQLSGYGNVSALAHLGGAAVGLLFWLYSRQSYRTAENKSAVGAAS